MPLIRYEIGDFATLSPKSLKCKVALPSLTRIIGRYRNTFTLADGRVLFPNVPMSGFRDYLGYSQIQIVQTEVDWLEVRYVPDGSERAPDSHGLEVWLQEGLDTSFCVKVIEVKEIPPSSDGKYEDFLSLVAK
jgi:phenylacetate-coenzyme A ligase PaaK-like adenylate-forming protein